MANAGVLETARPWPRICLIARRSLVEQTQRRTSAIRLSRGTAMRWIAARHGVAGHPVRRDRITAELNRLIASLDPTLLQSELYEFITEARPNWSQARRTRLSPRLLRARSALTCRSAEGGGPVLEC
jgi:hypothetical protein